MWAATASCSIAQGLGVQRSSWKPDSVTCPSNGEPSNHKLRNSRESAPTTVQAMEEVIRVQCLVPACGLRESCIHFLEMRAKCLLTFLSGLPSVDTAFVCLTASTRTRWRESC